MTKCSDEEFQLSNTSIKTLEIINKPQHFKFMEYPNLENNIVLSVFRIFSILIFSKINPFHIYQMSVEEIKNKIAEYYLSNESNFGIKLIANMKSLIITPEKLFWCYKVLKNIGDFSPASINKFNATCGVFVFSLKEILEHYGVIIDKKTDIKKLEAFNNYCISKIQKLEEIALKL